MRSFRTDKEKNKSGIAVALLIIALSVVFSASAFAQRPLINEFLVLQQSGTKYKIIVDTSHSLGINFLANAEIRLTTLGDEPNIVEIRNSINGGTLSIVRGGLIETGNKGSGGTVENGGVRVLLDTYTEFDISPNRVRFSFDVEFTGAAEVGGRRIVLKVDDLQGNSWDLQFEDIIYVYRAGNKKTKILSLTPKNAEGDSVSYTIEYEDEDTIDNIVDFGLLIAPAKKWFAGIEVRIEPLKNRVLLRTSSSRPYWVGGIGLNRNLARNPTSIAELNARDVSITTDSARKRITVQINNLQFRTGFSGKKKVFLSVTHSDNIGSASWSKKGTFRITAGLNAPKVLGISPRNALVPGSNSTNNGRPQVFSVIVSDKDGADDITKVGFRIAPTKSRKKDAFWVEYDIEESSIALFNDNGGNPTTRTFRLDNPPLPGRISNSQGTLILDVSKATTAGNLLVFDLGVQFSPGFAGEWNIYGFAKDSKGKKDGYAKKATVEISSGNIAPRAESVTPFAGNGSGEDFKFQFRDSDGIADLKTLEVFIHRSLDMSGNGVWVKINLKDNRFELRRDISGFMSTDLVGGRKLSNSFVEIDPGDISFDESRTTLVVTIPMTFKPFFAGAQFIYMKATDFKGNTSRWQTRGGYTVASGAPPEE